MGNRKLTQKQARRIADSQEKRADNTDKTGMIVTRFGKQALVADDDWRHYPCHFRQNLPAPVPGDNVVWHLEEENQGIITAIRPRKTVFTRANPQGNSKPVAANITQMIITVAPVPEISIELIDRYIIAASNFGFKSLILFNKCDLASSEEIASIQSLYQNLGYATLSVSALASTNLETLRQQLANEVSIFIGQSGVGKSSIINTLLPEVATRVGEISDTKGLGKHTTTRTSVFRIPTGGYLVDSPGVRTFKLWHAQQVEIDKGFRDIGQFAAQCKFRDCKHESEPDCAVKAALDAGEIELSRFESYLKIRADP